MSACRRHVANMSPTCRQHFQPSRWSSLVCQGVDVAGQGTFRWSRQVIFFFPPDLGVGEDDVTSTGGVNPIFYGTTYRTILLLCRVCYQPQKLGNSQFKVAQLLSISHVGISIFRYSITTIRAASSSCRIDHHTFGSCRPQLEAARTLSRHGPHVALGVMCVDCCPCV